MDSLIPPAPAGLFLIIRPPGNGNTADFPKGLDADFAGKVIRVLSYVPLTAKAPPGQFLSALSVLCGQSR
jgi:hypothetical protein